MKRDPVTPELRIAILRRDGNCVAPQLDPHVDACHGRLTLDHVKAQPMMARRAPSTPQHLVVLCQWHHIDSGWATSHRPLLREYLRTVAA